MKNQMTTTDSSSLLAPLETDGAWVVGGAVRDALARDCSDRCDIDIAIADAERWAHRSGEVLNAAAVKISPHFDIWRIPLSDGQIDVWNLPDNDIQRDLLRRDFTVNAMAVPLEQFRKGEIVGSLLDPLDGLSDVSSRRLRLVSGRCTEG